MSLNIDGDYNRRVLADLVARILSDLNLDAQLHESVELEQLDWDWLSTAFSESILFEG